MTESSKRGLLAAYRRLLRPLIRILIRNGIVFEEFQEVARRTYVDVALNDTQTDGQEAIDLGQVAALTGLASEEVMAIQERGLKERLDTNLNRASSALFGWHTDADFSGPYGVPLELRLDADRGTDFRELVRRFIGDAGMADELLGELIEAGAVVETEQGWFKAVSRTFIPSISVPSGMEHLARSVEDFVTTFDFNTQQADPRKRLFERQVYTSDGIRAEDLPRFQEFAYSKAKLLLDELDNWLAQLDRPNQSPAAKLTTGLGIYHYVDHRSNSNSHKNTDMTQKGDK
jgi:Family of unknown function (DUF6502)